MVSALSVAPSQFWEGNDGPWSTFNVNIGSPPQTLHVLPATSESSTWAVLEQGCPLSSPSNCSGLRGGIFSITEDTTFQLQTAQDGSPYFQLPFDSESPLNYSTAGEVGLDSLVLGWNGTNAPGSLENQVVAGFAAPFPWLGILGIRGIPNHVFNATSSQNGPLGTLRANGNIPSLYYGYTAGMPYTYPPMFGSLVLGGYDAARINMSNALTVPFQSTSIDLSVWVNHIRIGDTVVGGLENGVLALIDSVVPEIWLPLAACEAFEQALGLVWNSTAEMYLINSTQHATLVARNQSVTFLLGAEKSSQNSTAITLPYAAFDLVAKFPLAGITDGSSLRYFPLKRATTQNYFLGRTFLQAAYIAADYEKMELTVGQALFPGSQAISNIVTVDYMTSKATKLTKGDIAGIVIGAVAGVALLAGILFGLWWRRRQYYIRRENNRKQTSSVGDTTLAADTEVEEQEQREHRLNEYFKPGPIFPPPEDEPYAKPELDATETATGFRVQRFERRDRHELDHSVVRPSPHRSQVSWGSQGSMVSPTPNEDRVRSLELSDTSVDRVSGQGSPPMLGHHMRQVSSESSPGIYEMQ